MNCVAWSDANAYCEWKAMRLPREAEFEYAATRSTAGVTDTPWGDADAAKANLGGADAFPKTAAAGAMTSGASKDGALDLLGNVAEWQSDYLAPYTPEEVKNPTGPTTGDARVVRGGAYTGIVALAGGVAPLTAGHRESLAPIELSPVVGFRCAADLSKR